MLKAKSNNRKQKKDPLEKLVKLSRKYKTRKLKDLSKNMDDYLWGGKW